MQCYTERQENVRLDGNGHLVIEARKESLACFAVQLLHTHENGETCLLFSEGIDGSSDGCKVGLIFGFSFL